MRRYWIGGLFILLSCAAWADPDGEDGMSDECLRSVREVYKFYYYEIHPNPKSSCQAGERLSSTEALQMQMVIADLRKHCSQQVIAKINESLKSDTPGGAETEHS